MTSAFTRLQSEAPSICPKRLRRPREELADDTPTTRTELHDRAPHHILRPSSIRTPRDPLPFFMALPHTCTKVLHKSFVTLRYGSMTVPGRGGRPRKWRSDADRVRAWRARQIGRPEPPQLADLDPNEDELARRIEEVRQLHEQLRTLRQENRDLTAELNRTRRRITKVEHQVDILIVAESEAAWEAESLMRSIDRRAQFDPSTDRELFAQEDADPYTREGAPEPTADEPRSASLAPPNDTPASVDLNQWTGVTERNASTNDLNRAGRRRLKRQGRKSRGRDVRRPRRD